MRRRWFSAASQGSWLPDTAPNPLPVRGITVAAALGSGLLGRGYRDLIFPGLGEETVWAPGPVASLEVNWGVSGLVSAHTYI